MAWVRFLDKYSYRTPGFTIVFSASDEPQNVIRDAADAAIAAGAAVSAEPVPRVVVPPEAEVADG